jgi:hypothetical protein
MQTMPVLSVLMNMPLIVRRDAWSFSTGPPSFAACRNPMCLYVYLLLYLSIFNDSLVQKKRREFAA